MERAPKRRALAKSTLRIILGIVAQNYFAGTHTVSRYSGFGLQTHADIRGGASRPGATNDFLSATQGDSGARGTGEGLRSFSDNADGGLQIEVAGADLRMHTGGSWTVQHASRVVAPRRQRGKRGQGRFSFAGARSGTVCRSSRTKRSSSASAIRFAVGWPRTNRQGRATS